MVMDKAHDAAQHKLELQLAGYGDHWNGRCTCGNWSVYPGRWHDSKKEVKNLFKRHVEASKDAYFATASRDPYQYKEGEEAARSGKPNRPPYPDGSEARKMWEAGYRSTKKVA
jgi:hypothetical protein